MRHRTRVAVLAASCLLLRAPGQCTGTWVSGFGAPGADARISKLAAANDGTGAIYAAGWFAAIGEITASQVAKWDGTTWTALGAGLSGNCATGYGSIPGPCAVTAMVAGDAGSGPSLYVGGGFTVAGGTPAPSGMARWNGSAWSALPAGIGIPNAFAIYDDGTGPHLYAGGNYGASGLMKLAGSSWQPVPGVAEVSIANVRALAVIDLGSGPRLYAVGNSAGSAGNWGFFGRWNGSTWEGSALPYSAFASIAAVPGPSGVSVYVGAWFAGVTCMIGPSPGPLPGLLVEDLASFDDGTGPALYAAGYFGNSSMPGIARWNGTQWTSVGGGLGTCVGGPTGYALAVTGTGPGSSLFVGGEFMTAGTTAATNIARWDGNAWHSVTNAPTLGLGPQVYALKHASLPSGDALFAGGQLCFAGASAVAGVARYDATGWHPVGAGLAGYVGALESYDDGGGVALFAGGGTSLGAPTLNRWDGSNWAVAGGGLSGTYVPSTYQFPSVTCLRTFDDGSGPALFVGGFFDHAGGVPVSNIARWNGTSWSTLGGGLAGTASAPDSPGPSVLEVFDDGTGPVLYAAGVFSSAGGQPAQDLAKWNGTSWTPIPTGLPTYYAAINSIAAFDDGTGPALYVAGQFSTIGGFTAPGFVKWNGQSWLSAVQPPSTLGPVSQVRRLAVLDDGGGRALYAVVTENPPFTSTLRRWDGVAWTQIGVLDARAHAVYDDGSGPAIFIAGGVTFAGGIPAAGIAKWATPRPALALSQPGGPGSGVMIADAHLMLGHEYFNIFSTTPCPGAPGSGPYLGLCAPDPAPLLAQFNVPFMTPPFHIFAFTPSATFGPFPAPAGLVVDAICFDCCGPIGCISPVTRFTIQ